MKQLGILLLFLLASSVSAHDYIPGQVQDHPILLAGGDLYTVSGGVLEGTDILLENGRIERIGKGLSPPAECEVIDISGKHVYPGLIAPGTVLGLIEIGAVRATRDITEVGNLTPEVQTHIVYNPDSEILPTVRSNGITTAQIVPGGSLLRGRSCIMNLDGWTKEDAAVKLLDGIHLSWPAVAIRFSRRETRTPEKQKEAIAKRLRELKQAFEDARAYLRAKQADPDIDIDQRWEAMLPLFSGKLPLFVHANDYRQIEQAINFAREQNVRMILVGGREAWKLTDLLKQNEIPVIYGSVHSMPMRPDYAYDDPFSTPSRLHKAEVKFCIGLFSATGVRNLPFQAGQAVAFGLDKSEALRAITLSTAEILGISHDLGSLESGKKATIIVSDGDILDYLGHRVTHMFIEGRKVDLDNKHKELYRKYKAR